MKNGLRKWNFLGVKVFFYMNFDSKNGRENEFKDNNEKSSSWSRNKVSHKIDLKAVLPRNGHAAIVGVKRAEFSLTNPHNIAQRAPQDVIWPLRVNIVFQESVS